MSTLFRTKGTEDWEGVCPHTETLSNVSSCVGHLVRTAGIPRSSEEQLSHAYHLLMAQLSQAHAEVRLSAFQIVDALFTRSHQFRTLVISDLQGFLELTLGTDHRQPLPPPREVAQRLRRAALRAVQLWNEKFGAAYKKLALGHHFLQHNQQVRGPWLCLSGWTDLPGTSAAGPGLGVTSRSVWGRLGMGGAALGGET